RAQRSIRSLEDFEPILCLQREKYPGTSGIKVQMAGPESDSVRRSDRRHAGQLPIVIAKHLECSRILPRCARRFIASRDKDNHVITWQHANLMSVDADVQSS